jgi:hypothetical protein
MRWSETLVPLVAAALFAACTTPPPDAPEYHLKQRSTVVMTAPIAGVAAAPDGVWLLEEGSAPAAVEYDHLGGRELRRMSTPGADPFGLAWDGSALWIGNHGAPFAAAHRIDPASGAISSTLSLFSRTTDLAYDGTHLLDVMGDAGIEEIDVSDGLVDLIRVHDLDAVESIAYHDGEIWVAQPGGRALVYDASGTLLAWSDSEAFDGPETHMGFVGDDLVVTRGSSVMTFAIAR